MQETVMQETVTRTTVIAGIVGLTLAAALVAGCGGGEPAPAPAAPPERVENPAIGVAIAGLTGEHFTVAANEGDRLELVPTGEGATGRVMIVGGPPESGGVNLVAAVQEHKAEILARPDGDYNGSLEYASPLGTTFASRGRYTSGAGFTEEERVIYMVHPWGDRVLKVVYHYPAGEDSQARLDALMEAIVGELEGLPAAPAMEAGDTG